MHTNALVDEKSPYLQQHAHNPVDWLPWGEAAFEKARRDDKPIFLSIGYSTCHWCHVMAHESFEDESVAEVINRHFVPVKIDREERPDIDRVYMLFVQASTGSGGWPMSVWLTPDLKPFFGGTYFPPDGAYGRPGFRSVLTHLAAAWQNDRARILESSESVTAQLASIAANDRSFARNSAELAREAYLQFRSSFDVRYGGFGGAPKFPRPSAVQFLLRYAHSPGVSNEERDDAIGMVTGTLRAMASGGMHDHLGGGFHRYSVDERWFVPHFEKMLYDQAQLAFAYVEAFQVTSDPFFASIAEDILQYVLRDMTSVEGAFYSAEDADSTDPEDPSRHGEGAFYLWRQSEIEAVLGEDAAAFCRYFGVEANGNVVNDPHAEFTGRNILYANGSWEERSSVLSHRERLRKIRAQRPRPHLDRKILTSWNALMVAAFARAAGVLNDSKYYDAAVNAIDFLIERMYQPDTGVLFRRYCDGEAAIPAFADDYAFFAGALLDVFELTGEPCYLKTARDLCVTGLKNFEDENGGGFFSTNASSPDVLLRLKDEYDGAEPSANSVAIDTCLRLWELTGREDLRAVAERALVWLGRRLASNPTIAPAALSAFIRSAVEPAQTIIRCETISECALEIYTKERRAFAPFTAVLLLADQSIPSLADTAAPLAALGRPARFTIYRCRNLRCELPEQLN